MIDRHLYLFLNLYNHCLEEILQIKLPDIFVCIANLNWLIGLG